MEQLGLYAKRLRQNHAAYQSEYETMSSAQTALHFILVEDLQSMKLRSFRWFNYRLKKVRQVLRLHLPL